MAKRMDERTKNFQGFEIDFGFVYYEDMYNLFSHLPHITKFHFVNIEGEQIQESLDNFQKADLSHLKHINWNRDHKSSFSMAIHILRRLSQNESLKQTLELFVIQNHGREGNYDIFELLKAKSYGYQKCKIQVFGFNVNEIDICRPTITENDIRSIK